MSQNVNPIDIFPSPEQFAELLEGYNYLSRKDRSNMRNIVKYILSICINFTDEIRDNLEKSIMEYIEAKFWEKYKATKLHKITTYNGYRLSYDINVIYPINGPEPSIHTEKMVEILTTEPQKIQNCVRNGLVWATGNLTGIIDYRDKRYAIYCCDADILHITVKNKTGITEIDLWSKCGQLDRPETEGPAYIEYNTTKRVKISELYYRNGELHRENGPARTIYDKISGEMVAQIFYKNGVSALPLLGV